MGQFTVRPAPDGMTDAPDSRSGGVTAVWGSSPTFGNSKLISWNEARPLSRSRRFAMPTSRRPSPRVSQQSMAFSDCWRIRRSRDEWHSATVFNEAHDDPARGSQPVTQAGRHALEGQPRNGPIEASVAVLRPKMAANGSGWQSLRRSSSRSAPPDAIDNVLPDRCTIVRSHSSACESTMYRHRQRNALIAGMQRRENLPFGRRSQGRANNDLFARTAQEIDCVRAPDNTELET